jgi:PhnB protein
MASQVRPIPEGYHSVTPYLVVQGAAKAIDFYKRALGATELFRMEDGNRVGHAELQVGDSRVMLADEYPERGIYAPQGNGKAGVSLMLYVENVDDVVNRAVSAGATLERKVENQFYGDRSGSVIDPFGHRWYVATHVEDVSPEEMDRRMKAQMPA